MKLRLALPIAVLMLALPAAAQAATLDLDRSCYRPGQKGVISGTGYTPNAVANFTLDGVPFEGALADAAGNFAVGFTAGTPDGKQQRHTLAAIDSANPANTASAPFTVTDLRVTVTPKRGNPGNKKKIVARGFNKRAALFAHVRGPRKRNVKIGRPKGQCGKITKRKRILRAGDPIGFYTVQFDQRRRYSATTDPRYTFTVQVFRKVRASAAFSASLGSHAEVWTPSS